jgi:hypothetical protein
MLPRAHEGSGFAFRPGKSLASRLPPLQPAEPDRDEGTRPAHSQRCRQMNHQLQLFENSGNCDRTQGHRVGIAPPRAGG